MLHVFRMFHMPSRTTKLFLLFQFEFQHPQMRIRFPRVLFAVDRLPQPLHGFQTVESLGFNVVEADLMQLFYSHVGKFERDARGPAWHED